MPEIAEVARVVHFLRLHLVGKRILKASAQDDANVFGKVGTSGAEFAAAVKGKKVVSAGSQGKYFWLVLDKPPHPVMHLGMTGWVHIRGVRSAYTNYYKKMKPEEADLWPPKFWKFTMETEGPDSVEVAFTDPRRFGRVRLVDCPGSDIRQHSPLVENGPDPVVDADVFTLEYLTTKMRARHVPVKALLLDQAMISGIGNWVGDEVLYQARLHPEQYSNEFGDAEIKRLYDSIVGVCGTAVDLLGDSDKFPEHWLFNYRWGKGDKGKGGSSQLPNGQKLSFLTVGGRTSCYAPAVQKKSGSVVPGVEEVPIKDEPVETEEAGKKPNGKRAAASSGDPKSIPRDKKASAKNVGKEEEPEDDSVDDEQPAPKKRKKDEVASSAKKKRASSSKVAPTPASKPSASKVRKEGKVAVAVDSEPARRRSGRLNKS